MQYMNPPFRDKMNPPIFVFCFSLYFHLVGSDVLSLSHKIFFSCTWLLVSKVTLDIPKQVIVFEINVMLKYYLFVKCILAGCKLFI